MRHNSRERLVELSRISQLKEREKSAQFRIGKGIASHCCCCMPFSTIIVVNPDSPGLEISVLVSF